MTGYPKAKRIFGILEFIFFSNYFYGLCAVVLSIEALLQQHIPLNGFAYFFLIFIITVLYYSYPYVRKISNSPSDRRQKWNNKNFELMRLQQIAFIIILFATSAWFFTAEAVFISSREWIPILLFPLIAVLYYGINFFSAKYNLRKIGELKAFLIGFTWAGLVTIYPVLFYNIHHRQEYHLSWIGGLLFIKNFMFITLLAVIFDIKDYATDCMSNVRTFVVNLGLRKTIFYVVFPLTAIGLGAFILYAIAHQFSELKIILNVIPFILLFIVAKSLYKRRSILYYLTIVDGLMLIKAVCGSVAMSCF